MEVCDGYTVCLISFGKGAQMGPDSMLVPKSKIVLKSSLTCRYCGEGGAYTQLFIM